MFARLPNRRYGGLSRLAHVDRKAGGAQRASGAFREVLTSKRFTEASATF